MRSRVVVSSILSLALVSSCYRHSQRQKSTPSGRPPTGNAIFLHPDGMSLGHWDALRLVAAGPDGHLAWDRLPHVAIYRAHPKGSLGINSNAGATIHAYGVKATTRSFGREPEAEITAASGQKRSVMMEAKARGLAVGLVQTAALTDPGTAVFMAKAKRRDDHDAIAAQLIEADIDVLLGGGEAYLLPKGVKGRFGEGTRHDGRDLIAEAKKRGYTVVYTREQLKALPPKTPKVLGVFAHGDTFNDDTEEALRKRNLPHYLPDAPSIAEMVSTALKLLSSRGRRFFLVGEEEGTDNFSNHTNASGFIAAARRADAAVDVARRFVVAHPDTLLVVGSDSNANGLQIAVDPRYAEEGKASLAPRIANGCPADGAQGTGSKPFTSGPDREGKRYPFSIVWGADDDTLSNMVVRAAGLNAELVHGTLDNTAVYALLYYSLFGRGVGAICGLNIGRSRGPLERNTPCTR